jgi:hypothetical protein
MLATADRALDQYHNEWKVSPTGELRVAYRIDGKPLIDMQVIG